MIVRTIILSVSVIVSDSYEKLVYDDMKELPQWVKKKAIEVGEEFIPVTFYGYRVAAVKDVEFECIEMHGEGMTAFFNMRIETR